MPKREIHREEEVTMHDSREISEDELQEMKERTDSARKQAIEALEKGDSFAVFVMGSGTGKHGVEVVVAGEMGLGETMELLNTMHETIETIAEGVTIEVKSAMHSMRKKRRG